MAGRNRRYVLKARAESTQRTRRRILEAARETLLTSAFDELTLPAVAGAAGVTTQTVRNHFDSKDGLLRALADTMAADQSQRRRQAAPVGSAAVAAMLVAEYEEYGAALSRLLPATERSPVLAEIVRRGRREHHEWLEATFAGHLPSRKAARRRALAGLYAATDVGTWRLVRLDLGHSREMTADVIRALIDGILAGPDH